MAKSVMILFPGLTHAGTMYNYGDIEPNPDEFLLEAARDKLTQFHRDSGRLKRICKFAPVEISDFDEMEDEVEDEVTRTPVFLDGGFDDDLENRMRPELVTLASSLGFQKKIAKQLRKPQLIKLVRFLRTI